MEEQGRKWREVFLRFIGGDKKKKLLLFLGIGGMILLMLSEWIPSKAKTKTPEETGTSQTTAAENSSYAQAMEKKLSETVGKISGVGACQILLTLENGTESVYAQNKTNEEATDASKENKKEAAEYIVIKGENGEEALKVKEIEPRVRGVMVVCEGGEDPLVRQRVMEAMTALFDLSSTRVSITKMRPQ